MKKLLLLAAIILSLFTACEEQKGGNELAGTLWGESHVLHDYVLDIDHHYEYYIEFIDDNKVKVWGDDGSDEGTYEIEGNTIYFYGLSPKDNFNDITKYISATFTSNSLNLKYEWGLNLTNHRTYYKK